VHGLEDAVAAAGPEVVGAQEREVERHDTAAQNSQHTRIHNPRR
jgi:hypothetical protein